MNFNYPYLKNQNFLKKIDKVTIKEQNVKITILSVDEKPIQEIQGKCIGGSLTIDGHSAVRRTGSLSVLADEYKNDLTDLDNLFAINKRCALEIGFTNTFEQYTEYPIIWYPLGIFLFDNPAIQRSTQGITISLNLKDKMCLLDGSAGGVYPASVELDYVDDIDGKKPVLIQQIVSELVNHFGGIPLSKMIIADIPNKIRVNKKWISQKTYLVVENPTNESAQSNKLLKYQIVYCGGTPYADLVPQDSEGLTYKRKVIQHSVTGMINTMISDYDSRGQSSPYYSYFNKWDEGVEFEELDPSDPNYEEKLANKEYQIYSLKWERLITVSQKNNQGFIYNGQSYLIFGYGSPIGFTYEDFTYPSNQRLIANAGDSITSILDKIIQNVLGNFEYFFDTQGNFVFQEKKNYLNISQSSVIEEALKDNAQDEPRKSNPLLDYSQYYNFDKYAYNFNSQELVVNISNTPQYNNINNDFIVWGCRKGADGDNKPIRFHLAIDKKPNCKLHKKRYWQYQLKKTEDGTENLEFRYQPLLNEADGINRISIIDPRETPTNPEDATDKQQVFANRVFQDSIKGPFYIETTDWRTELYLQGIEAETLAIYSNYYFVELVTEWGKMYEMVDTGRIWDKTKDEEFNEDPQSPYDPPHETIPIYSDQLLDHVIYQPYYVDYYLDFIDTSSGLNKISVENIGRKPYSKTEENKITCMFYPEPPEINWIDPYTIPLSVSYEDLQNNYQRYLQGYSYARIIDEVSFKEYNWNTTEEDKITMDSLGITGYCQISIANTNWSCFEEVRDALYQHTNYNEAISMQTIPIYYLEPNTRIQIIDQVTGVNGEYLIGSLSYSFEPSATMTIAASKIQQKI